MSLNCVLNQGFELSWSIPFQTSRVGDRPRSTKFKLRSSEDSEKAKSDSQTEHVQTPDADKY
ncbi:CLUMA_CG016736, isoform A [Clunio marinus]|uniref:CLUMA_CG016736, isoform A n=1 Tax=Clunio marinus TaxID=568069 RepID=A0A1J1IVG1_9DIPT|nr:CLUMA_CG016736, isoform A [Clunio marinus]